MYQEKLKRCGIVLGVIRKLLDSLQVKEITFGFWVLLAFSA